MSLLGGGVGRSWWLAEHQRYARAACALSRDSEQAADRYAAKLGVRSRSWTIGGPATSSDNVQLLPRALAPGRRIELGDVPVDVGVAEPHELGDAVAAVCPLSTSRAMRESQGPLRRLAMRCRPVA